MQRVHLNQAVISSGNIKDKKEGTHQLDYNTLLIVKILLGGEKLLFERLALRLTLAQMANLKAEVFNSTFELSYLSSIDGNTISLSDNVLMKADIVASEAKVALG